MRSKLTKPPPLFVDELRKAGYRVFWPGKTDFNFDVPKGWVDSTRRLDEEPEAARRDKPFFAYFNITVTHESQVRATPAQYAKNTARLKPTEKHDPAKVKLPPYYPDTPDVRRMRRHVPRQHHRDGLHRRRRAEDARRQEAQPRTRSSSSSATTAGA